MVTKSAIFVVIKQLNDIVEGQGTYLLMKAKYLICMAILNGEVGQACATNIIDRGCSGLRR